MSHLSGGPKMELSCPWRSAGRSEDPYGKNGRLPSTTSATRVVLD